MIAMPRRDRWWWFLARALPWFNPDAYQRDRERTAQALSHADRVIMEARRVESFVRGPH
jgi:hypothetical protein